MAHTKSESSDVVELVRRAYDGLSRGDLQDLLALFDESSEWFEAEQGPYFEGAPFRGPAAITQGVFARLGEDFDGFTVDVQRMSGMGNTVLVEARYYATHKKSGNPLDVQVAHVWEFNGATCVRWQQYTDTYAFHKVTGTVGKPRSGV